jgi:hypothetical protein
MSKGLIIITTVEMFTIEFSSRGLLYYLPYSSRLASLEMPKDIHPPVWVVLPKA